MKLGNILVMGLTTLALTPSSWAWVGGPWDHLIKGIYTRQNTDGLYEASISMRNGSGFLRFVSNTGRATLADPYTVTTGLAIQGNNVGASATNTTAGLAARSNTVIFHKGMAYYGSVYGTVNSFSKKVSGGGGGQSSVVDSVETAIQQFAQQIQAFVNINGFSESMNITFEGSVVSQVPEIRFEAEGEAIFFNRPNIEVGIVDDDDDLFDLDEIDPLYEITVQEEGDIKPTAVVPLRLLGGRVNLATSFSNTTQSTVNGLPTNTGN